MFLRLYNVLFFYIFSSNHLYITRRDSTKWQKFGKWKLKVPTDLTVEQKILTGFQLTVIPKNTVFFKVYRRKL